MEWSEARHADSMIFTLNVRNGGWSELVAGLSACLEKAALAIPNQYSAEQWDSVFCDCWLDSGRALFCPGKGGRPLTPRRVTVQLLSSFLQAEFDQLPHEEADRKGFAL